MQLPVRPLKSIRSMLALFAAMTFFVACQSTETVTPEGVKDIAFSFSVDRAAIHPDSTSWSVKTKSGNANLGHDSSTINDTFSVSIHLQTAIGTDTLFLSLWRNHMLTSHQAFRVAPDGNVTPLGNGHDTLAITILDRLASLNDSFPGAYPLNQDSSMAKAMAVLLVQGDPLFKNWQSAFPVGIDTARVRREALEYAAALGKTLTEIVSSWNLGMTFEQARSAILDLVPSAIPASDTDALFPTPAVRVATPVSLSSDLHSDSTSVSVKGLFVAKKRLYPPVFMVTQGGIEAKDHFEIVWQKSPAGGATSWDLAADGGVTIRAYGDAPAGTYTLSVSMDDGSFADTSKVDFKVLAKPDREGPVLTRVSPPNDTNVAFADSAFLFRVKATDSAGVASVTLNGKSMTKTGTDEYQLSDTLHKKGVISEYVVQAKDNHGNTSEIVVRILREGSNSAKPTATPLQPSSRTGDTIPTTQTTRHIVWKLTDPVGISPSSVMINLQPATKVNDSTWSADIAIPPTGKATTVLVQALNIPGNGVVDSVRIVRRADVVPPSIGVVSGARAVFFDTTSAKVVWKISDNLKLDSVWVNGVPQALRADSTYTANIALATGFNMARIRAKDSSGNMSSDSQQIQRLVNNTPPVLFALPGTVDQTVAYTGTDSLLVRWRVTGNDRIDSVVINGAKANFSKDTFWLKIALSPGKNPIVAQAWNSSPKASKDSIMVRTALKDAQGNLYRILKMPDGRYWLGQNLYTTPNFTCALSNCPANGAIYTWKQAFLADSAATAPQGVCPTGWHVATRTEWSTLFKSIVPSASTDSTLALRSSTGWHRTNCVTTNSISTCKTDSTNGTNQFENFLVPNGNGGGGGSGGSVSYNYAELWLPGGSGTTLGNALNLLQASLTDATRSKSTLGTTNAAGIRCIKNQLKVIGIPIDIIKTPILGL